MKRSPLRRKTPLRQKTSLQRTAIKRRRRNPQADFSPSVREFVERRSRGVCELGGPGCTARATHMHHRLPRRFGDHSADNALHVCPPCHHHAHTSPERYEMGWMIRGN